MEKLTQEEMIQAIFAREASYDGKFYFGVITTKIFCLPSCSAKKPRIQNVVLFETQEEAIAAGYRGCQKCKAEFYPHIKPLWFENILSFMEKEDTKRITEDSLVKISGVNISTVRRHFKSFLQTTPLAYHRKLRLDKARNMIEKGLNYSTVVKECGFKSLSGFREAFIKEFGHAPGEVDNVRF